MHKLGEWRIILSNFTLVYRINGANCKMRVVPGTVYELLF